MANELIARLRKQREFRVSIGRHVFIGLRPTDVEAIALHRANAEPSDIAAQLIVGWEKVTEDDIVGGGGTDPIPFDRELWAAWCADRPDFWGAIAEAALDAYKLHAEALDAAAKN